MRTMRLWGVCLWLEFLLCRSFEHALDHDCGGECDQALMMLAVQKGRTLKDNPMVPGWLVERLYHQQPILCPWLKATEMDEDCKDRHARLQGFRNAISTCKHPFRRTDRSIGHRGAPLVAPEETVESWAIGAESGAGYLECDVSLTGDLDLVCRHGTCDLAFTTDLVTRHPDLNAKCSTPFTPGSGKKAVCCTYDFTMEELGRLCATMESVVNASAASTQEYVLGAPRFRSGGIAEQRCHKLVAFGDYLKLLKRNTYHAIPELKDTMETGLVEFLEGKGKDIYWLASSFATHLKDAGFTPWPQGKPQKAAAGTSYGVMQTFDHRIAEHWKKEFPAMTVEFMWESSPPAGEQCVQKNGQSYLGDCGGAQVLKKLQGLGVELFSPPINLLVASGRGHRVEPSATAQQLRKMGVNIGSWSLDRQGCNAENTSFAWGPEPNVVAPCGRAEGWSYYDSVEGKATFQYADVLEVLDALFQKVGIVSLFADWPASVSTYVNCILEPSDEL